MEATGSPDGLHPEVREVGASHEALRREARADLSDVKRCDNGALEVVGSDPRQRMEQTFPNKLHYMLDHGLEESETDVIAWQPHGRAFLVLDQRRFVAELLPNWFRQNKYQSFQVRTHISGRSSA
jgi:HSF-type DNA-binding